MKTKRGSNQYKAKYHKNVGAHLAFLAALIFFFTCANAYYNFVNFPPKANAQILSPVASSSATLVTEEPNTALSQPVVDSPVEEGPIQKEIKEVFGKYSDKAFKLLSCENASFNPTAVNTAGNSPAGSRDMGVFQINEYWQKVNGKFLLDPSINIRIAYKIFEDSGYSFKMWTCGRKYGI